MFFSTTLPSGLPHNLNDFNIISIFMKLIFLVPQDQEMAKKLDNERNTLFERFLFKFQIIELKVSIAFYLLCSITFLIRYMEVLFSRIS